MSSQSFEQSRETVPLAALLDEPSLSTKLLAPSPSEIVSDPRLYEAVRATPIAAPVVVELADPRPYVAPADLVLITGLSLPTESTGVREYVDRLCSAGAAALVFGIEPVHSSVPTTLLDACVELRLPLLELPPEVHFTQLVAYFIRALETERTRTLTAMNSVARRLAAGALQPDPTRRLLEVLACTSSGWAILDDGLETRCTEELPDGMTPETVLRSTKARLTTQSGKRDAIPAAFSSFQFDDDDYEVVAHEIVVRGNAAPSVILALVKTSRITNTDRTALLLAANLVQLVMQLPAQEAGSVDQLTMQFLVNDRAISSQQDQGRFSRLLRGALGASANSAHAVVAVRANGSKDSATASDLHWFRQLLRTPLMEERSSAIRAYVANPPTPVDLMRARDAGWLLAVSPPHDFGDLPRAMFEAEELGRSVWRLQRHAEGHRPESIKEFWPLAAVTDPVLSSGAARHWLAPLEAPAHREAAQALEEWLRHHGSWDRTARSLGVHRNTIRRLVAEAEQALKSDLSDAVERARLLLAFDVRNRRR